MSSLLLLAPGGSAAAPPNPVPGERAAAVQAARLYLGQSLAALTQAIRYASQVGQLGPLEGFDLAKYLRELDLVAGGLEQYLTPHGPPPGPAAPVEITGQFLADGLSRALPPAPPAATEPIR